MLTVVEELMLTCFGAKTTLAGCEVLGIALAGLALEVLLGVIVAMLTACFDAAVP